MVAGSFDRAHNDRGNRGARKMRFLAWCLGVQLALAGTAFSQPADDRRAALAAFAQELAELQAMFPDTANEMTAMQSGMLDGIWEDLIEGAHELQRRWKDNPYIEVTGFTVTIGWPSVHVDFAFKDQAD